MKTLKSKLLTVFIFSILIISSFICMGYAKAAEIKNQKDSKENMFYGKNEEDKKQISENFKIIMLEEICNIPIAERPSVKTVEYKSGLINQFSLINKSKDFQDNNKQQTLLLKFNEIWPDVNNETVNWVTLEEVITNWSDLSDDLLNQEAYNKNKEDKQKLIDAGKKNISDNHDAVDKEAERKDNEEKQKLIDEGMQRLTSTEDVTSTEEADRKNREDKQKLIDEGMKNIDNEASFIHMVNNLNINDEKQKIAEEAKKNNSKGCDFNSEENLKRDQEEKKKLMKEAENVSCSNSQIEETFKKSKE